MKKILILTFIPLVIGCKNNDQEPTHEWIHFIPENDSIIFVSSIRRYIDQPIEDVFKQSEERFGVKYMGVWIGNDSIRFTRIDSVTFVVDTIR